MISHFIFQCYLISCTFSVYMNFSTYLCIIVFHTVCYYVSIIFRKEIKEEFEDTKGVIRICESKDRQHNGQKKKDKNDKQWSTKYYTKTKVRVTRTPLTTGGELRCSGRVSSSCSNVWTRPICICKHHVIGEWNVTTKKRKKEKKETWL
jgi:hypothetical protein